MTYYDALNIQHNASMDEICQAFRVLAKKYHPDLNNEYNAKEKFIYIYEAYSILKDSEKRRIYDELINKKDNVIKNNINESRYNEWKNEAEKEGKYYSENNYDEFLKNVLEKLLVIGKKTAEITVGIVFSIIFGLLIGALSAVLKIIIYIIPVGLFGGLVLLMMLGQFLEYIPLIFIALVLSIMLSVFIHKKLHIKILDDW